MLLRDCAKEREKETQIHTHINFFIKTHVVLKTKHHLPHNISKPVNFKNRRKCMIPLNEHNMIQVDEKNIKICIY